MVNYASEALNISYSKNKFDVKKSTISKKKKLK